MAACRKGGRVRRTGGAGMAKDSVLEVSEETFRTLEMSLDVVRLLTVC